MPIKINALRFDLNDGHMVRPIYLAALPADQLITICEVPSFEDNTDESIIAGNVLRPPIKEWQRPLDHEKVDAIRDRFDKPGEFMPNPVLLAVAKPESVVVRPLVLNDQVTPAYEIEIEVDPSNSSKPLWVLDGQHRLNGLASATHATNPIPFVLLHSTSANVYQPHEFAKIFAEVSTAATPLQELHSEWLEFAFGLGHYNSDAPGQIGINAPLQHNAMEVVALLCDRQSFNDGAVNNPYFNKIQFNPRTEPKPVHANGFRFDALNFKDWIYSEYYHQPTPSFGHLPPEKVARELALATKALITSIQTPALSSAFFGEGSKRHQYIERAFICGALTRLLVEPDPDWLALLSDLKFPETDWEFTWVRTTGGKAGTISRRIAHDVFCEAFRSGSVYQGTSNLVTYLRGDRAAITLVQSFVLPSGVRSRSEKKTDPILVEGSNVLDTHGRSHIQLMRGNDSTTNIGHLDIWDPDQPRGTEFTTSSFKRGVLLHDKKSLKVLADTYGGRQKELELEIKVD